MTQINGTFTIKLPQFEGPFDLLLFFIERDELDIYDIPIAKITDEFLSYVQQMEALNINLASEFILVAATLMRIKAKMLIPRKAIDEEGNEIDPREELVARLLEYKKFKSVLDEFRDLESDRHNRISRGNSARELKQLATKALVDVELESLTLFKLMRSFEKVMERFEDRGRKAVHTVYTYDYTLSGQQDFIMTSIRTKGRCSFENLFDVCKERIHAIFTFLALLELVHLQEVSVTQGDGMNNFWVEPVVFGEEE